MQIANRVEDNSSDDVDGERLVVGSIGIRTVPMAARCIKTGFGLHGRRVWRTYARKCLKLLVDLKGFEPLTSSMPFKNFQ